VTVPIDTLNVKAFAKQSGLDEAFIRSHPAILKLVRKAIKQDWLSSAQGKANFQKAFEQTPWFKKNASWARGYILAQAQGGADFEANRETAREFIRGRAQQLGATLSDEALEAFTTAYFMNGWGEEGRQGFLDRALAGELEDFDTSFIDFTKGGPQSVMSALRKTARANGVPVSDSYLQGAARSVIAGLSTVQDYDAEIRRTAASARPQYADRILAGEDFRDIVSPYLNTYAKMFDLDPDAVDLDDPNVKLLFNRVDEKGNPTTMGLWDYEKELRKTDGWQYTRDAHDRVANLTGEIVRMFGFGG
jgi:hypothetical protein